MEIKVKLLTDENNIQNKINKKDNSWWKYEMLMTVEI